MAFLLACTLISSAVCAEGADIDRLIEQLGSNSFAEREAAAKKLEAVGQPALEALLRTAHHQDAEIRRRVERLLVSLQAQFHREQHKKLAGSWKLTALEYDGNKVDEQFVLGMIGFFSNTNLVVWKLQGPTGPMPRGEAVWNFQVSRARDATRIEFKSVTLSGHIDVQEKLVQGIYELTGDTLRLCVDMGERRPEKFETRRGTALAVMVLKRER
jgi:uncharacterized protein (TIGR03067 family)